MNATARSWSARTRGYTWGIVDQSLSSATNLGFFVLAGRTLGPKGLGVIVIGFSGYILAIGFQRSLLTTPLVASTAGLDPERRHREIKCGLTMEIVGAFAATLLVLTAGLVLPGGTGRGLLILSPWVFPALLQDFWRAVLFQEGRARSAAANDGSWALIMGLTAPFAVSIGAEWAIAGCWGSGAAAGAFLGFFQLRSRPALTRDVFAWWRRRLWPFGRWLGFEGVVYWATTSTTVFILNGFVGTEGVGGLRAAQSAFAPLSFVLPAIVLPGLPATVRALNRSVQAAISLSVRLSVAVTALAAVYVCAMLLLGGRVIPLLFGESFSGFKSLVVPIGVWQLVGGVGAGFIVLLTAQKRGRNLLLIRGGGAFASMASISLLAWTHGVTGAAWGYAVGGVITTAAALALTRRSYRSDVRTRDRQLPGLKRADS